MKKKRKNNWLQEMVTTKSILVTTLMIVTMSSLLGIFLWKDTNTTLINMFNAIIIFYAFCLFAKLINAYGTGKAKEEIKVRLR